MIQRCLCGIAIMIFACGFVMWDDFELLKKAEERSEFIQYQIHIPENFRGRSCSERCIVESSFSCVIPKISKSINC